MNLEPSQDYREQMEVRIVAWLLGEASDFEAAELQQAMQKDPALAEFHAHMQRTIGLVQAASGKVDPNPQTTASEPKLSAERRQVLLDRFQQPKVTPMPVTKPARRSTRWLVPLALAAGIIVLVSPLILSSRGRTKSLSAKAVAPAQEFAERNAGKGMVLLRGPSAIARQPDSEQRGVTALAGTAATPSPQVDTEPKPLPKVFLPSASPESAPKSAGNAETREKVEMAERPMAPLDLKLPIPAFMGVPTDVISSPADALRGNEPAIAARPEGRGAISTSAGVSLGFASAFAISPSDRADYFSTSTPARPGNHVVQNWDFSAKSDGLAAGRSGGGGFGGGQTAAGGFAISPRSTTTFYDYSGAPSGPSGGADAGAKAGVARDDQFGAYSRRGNLGDDSGRPLERFQALADAGTRTAGLGLDQENQTRNRQDSDRQKVPQLGDVPLLGHRFVRRSVPEENQYGRTRLVQQQEARKLSEEPAIGVIVKKTNSPVPAAPAPMATAEMVPPGIALADANGVVSRPLEERLNETKESAAEEEQLVRGTGVRAKESASTLAKAKKEAALDEGAGEQGTIGGGSTVIKSDDSRMRSKLQLDEAKRQYAALEAKKIQEKDQADTEDLKAGKPMSNREREAEGASVPQKPPANLPIPQPEVSTRDNPFSTFSLNVSDVSFKLAEASLENGTLPDPATIRVEEFVNAFHYRDPAPPAGARLAFAWERAHYPFAHNRDVLRFSIQTAAVGRERNQPLNLVILLDNSGSMERPDRVQILREALLVLAQQLRSQDRISVIAFARTARLWVDGMPGGNAQAFLAKVLDLNPEGGTNLEEAMNLGYTTAVKHFKANGMNRVILLTDGAANLGNVDPEQLKLKVIAYRQKGIALDCFGIGWEGYNDDLLEILSHNGDGRYGFLNQPEQAAPEFANQLAGALNVAAADVKTQVEFNPRRMTTWRQIGYARHQLTKEQFRDNTVDAAEIAAAESGNALYVVEINPQGSGPIGVVRVRFKVPATGEYFEQEWPIPFQPRVAALDQASPAMRLAATAAVFGEWLARSPYAEAVRLADMAQYLGGVAEVYAPDPRPAQLAWMIQLAQALAGK